MQYRVLARTNGSVVNLLGIGEAKVALGIGAAASFSFVIYPNDPMYGKLTQLTTYIDVVRDGEYVFRGRVVAVTPKNNNDGSFWQEVTCESALAYLNDTLVMWERVNEPPGNFFRRLINDHNNQVDDERKLKIGNVNVTNSTNNVYCYVEDGITTLAEINADLIGSERLGGELSVRYESDGNYIDWTWDAKVKGEQEIVLTRNLIELTTTPDISTVASVLYPFGATQDSNNNTTDDKAKDVSTPKINIKSVNGGKPYIIDDYMFSRYGWVAKSNTWDSVKDPRNLLNKARDYLSELRKVKLSYTLTAVDMYPLGVVGRPFELGKYYHVVNQAVGLDEWLRIIGISLDLDKPLETTYTIGDQTKRMIDYTMDALQIQSKIKNLSEQNAFSVSELDSLRNENEVLRQETQDIRSEFQAQIDALKKQINQGQPPEHIGKIIDVSEWQGVIDWNAVIKDDVSLSIIRVQDGSSHQDLKYMENIQKCISAGGKYAVYAYFRAVSTADAQQEAQDFYDRVQRVVAGKQQPIFYALDIESVEMGGSASMMRAGVEAYMNKLNALGIPDSKIVLYIADHLYDQFNLNVARPGAIWIPSYGLDDGTLANSTKPTHPCDLHQYTSKGSVNGITGNVDMNAEPSDRFKQAFL